MNIDQYVGCRALSCYGKIPSPSIRGLIIAVYTMSVFLVTASIAQAQISSYTYVAAENATVNFSTPVDVAFGANSSFAYKYGMAGNITFSDAIFGDPDYGVLKSGYYKAFTHCAGELGSYTFTIPVEAAYGANGLYFYKLGVSGTVNFTPAFFGGDPDYGVVKAGYYMPYTQCAGEGGSYTFATSTNVAYGANGKYYFLYGVTGTIVFTPSTFGGDPDYGVVKAGYFRPASGFGAIVSRAQFNQMFPNANSFYSYSALVNACTAYPGFCTSGNATQNAQEAAAFLANVAHETGGLVYINEIAQAPYCSGSATPCGVCASGQEYYGRGPMQISWNYNYCACGQAIGQNLWGNPNLVSTNATISWQTGLWYWMTQTGATSTTSHQAILNGDFDGTIRAINGGVECNGGDPAEVQDRLDYYLEFLQDLGVGAGSTATGC